MLDRTTGTLEFLLLCLDHLDFVREFFGRRYGAITCRNSASTCCFHRDFQFTDGLFLCVKIGLGCFDCGLQLGDFQRADVLALYQRLKSLDRFFSYIHLGCHARFHFLGHREFLGNDLLGAHHCLIRSHFLSLENLQLFLGRL